MPAKQSLKQAITQTGIEAAKAAIMVGKEPEILVSTARPVKGMPRTGSSVLKQSTFYCKASNTKN